MRADVINSTVQEPTAGDQPVGRVALVCDYLEEEWPSMDLVADMLFHSFKSDHAAEMRVEQLRPPLRRRFSAIPFTRESRLLRNADRLVNRFNDYPHWLRNRASDFDLFHIVDHSYAQLALELPPARSIVTCHDLDTFRCLLEPDREPRPRWFRAMTRRILKGLSGAAHVICPSAATKAAMLRHGLCSEDRITVIHNGAHPLFSAPPEAVPSDVANFLGAAKPDYLMHVGSTIPRKRIDVLLRVYAKVLKDYPQIRLVRVGTAFTAEQSALAASLGLSGKIIEFRRLATASLAALYRGAAILLQPSEAEGFGLPVVEAMMCGCPVLASDIEALREAGGTAAAYTPVADIENWSETLTRLLRERQEFPDRWEARCAGARRHASRFTWSGHATETLKVYRRVLEQNTSELA